MQVDVIGHLRCEQTLVAPLDWAVLKQKLIIGFASAAVFAVVVFACAITIGRSNRNNSRSAQNSSVGNINSASRFERLLVQPLAFMQVHHCTSGAFASAAIVTGTCCRTAKPAARAIIESCCARHHRHAAIRMRVLHVLQ